MKFGLQFLDVLRPGMKLLSSLTFTSRLKCQILALFSSCVSQILSIMQLLIVLQVKALMTCSTRISNSFFGLWSTQMATTTQILIQSPNSDSRSLWARLSSVCSSCYAKHV